MSPKILATFRLLQIKLKEYQLEFGVSKAQSYSNLGLTTTKNLELIEMSNLIDTIQNALNSAPKIFKIAFLKISLVLTFVGSQIEKLLKKFTSLFKIKSKPNNQFKTQRIYNKNGKFSSFICKRQF